MRKYFYISLINPFKTMRLLKGVFKPLKCSFKFKSYPFTWFTNPALIQIISRDVTWKDKYDTPRYEDSPYIWIHIFKWDFLWKWELPNSKRGETDDYWEQALWYIYYSDLDINKAERTWPWESWAPEVKESESTWNKDFLI